LKKLADTDALTAFAAALESIGIADPRSKSRQRRRQFSVAVQ
jgi:hypothetical protein